MISVRLKNLSFEYKWFTPSDYKDVGIRKFESYRSLNSVPKCFYTLFDSSVEKEDDI